MPPNAPPDVRITGNVRAPLDQAWEVFSRFGSAVQDWWSIAEEVSIEGGEPEAVGCVRVFRSSSGYTYREELVTLDAAGHELEYALRGSEPPLEGVEGIRTSVTLSSNVAGQTTMVWESRIDAPAALKPVMQRIQRQVYLGAIRDLDRHFNQPLGTLEVELVSGVGPAASPPPAYFVVLGVEGADPATSLPAAVSTEPSWGESFTFDLFPQAQHLTLDLFDAHRARFREYGEAEVALRDLPVGEVCDLTLSLGEGAQVTVRLKVTLAGDATELPPVDPKAAERLKLKHLLASVGDLRHQATDIVTGIVRGAQDRYQYTTYSPNADYPQVPLQELPKRVEGLPGGEVLQAEKVGRFFQRLTEYVHSQLAYGRQVVSEPDPFSVPFGQEIELPLEVATRWRDDDEFCRQLLQGLNPLVVERVQDLERVPHDMRGLQHRGLDLAALQEDNRLFLLDYASLETLSPYKGMYFYAPWVLLARPEVSCGAPLEVLGIQLTRNPPGRNPVYTPGSDTPNRYLFAKAHVMCADVQIHQWTNHLGLAHLVMEPFAIAIHNVLGTHHPIGRLLAPHFKDTLGINYLARRTLVSETTPFTDSVFATGTVQALAMVLEAWRSFDFEALAFPVGLARRGFDRERSDGLEGYYYRDDGFQIWDALGEYVRDVVGHFYVDDAAVAGDATLQEWCAESRDPDRAAIPGFPEALSTRRQLGDVLQTILFQVSAGHSVVNYPQLDYQGYVPNRPPALFRPMPEGEGDISQEYIWSALPSAFQTHFQVLFSHILTMPSQTPLTSVRAMAEECPAAHLAFQARLEAIGSRIEARNRDLAARGLPAYPYLHPENVAASIEI